MDLQRTNNAAGTRSMTTIHLYYVRDKAREQKEPRNVETCRRAVEAGRSSKSPHADSTGITSRPWDVLQWLTKHREGVSAPESRNAVISAPELADEEDSVAPPRPPTGIPKSKIMEVTVSHTLSGDPRRDNPQLPSLEPGQIRLLDLQHSSEETLICDIITTTIVRQRYIAISYTWNSNAFDHAVFYRNHEGSFTVTASCHNALLAARAFVSTTKAKHWLFWIDQICINQNDVLEKNRQILLMHSIFSNAIVMAWLGDYCRPPQVASDTSRPEQQETVTYDEAKTYLDDQKNLVLETDWLMLPQPLSSHRSLPLNASLLKGLGFTILSEHANDVETKLRHRESKIEQFTARELEFLNRLADVHARTAWLQIFKAPYFTRRWVLEEVTNTLVFFVIDGYCLHFHKLVTSLVYVAGLLRREGEYFRAWDGLDSFTTTVFALIDDIIPLWWQQLKRTTSSPLDRLPFDPFYRKSDRANGPRRMHELLEFYRRTKYENIRDCFYAIRALADDVNIMPVPDYSLEPTQIFNQHLSAMLLAGDGPRIVARSGLFNGPQRLDLPSFYPGWILLAAQSNAQSPSYLIQLNSNYQSTIQQTSRRGRGWRPIQVNTARQGTMRLDECTRRLFLTGVIVDEIQTIFAVEDRRADQPLFAESGSEVLHKHSTPDAVALQASLLDYHKSGTFLNLTTRRGAVYEILDAWIARQYLDVNDDDRQDPELAIEDVYQDRKLILNRNFCVGKEPPKMLGLVPFHEDRWRSAQPGDLIVAFDGFPVLMCIRRQQQLSGSHTVAPTEELYQVIGDAYFSEFSPGLPKRFRKRKSTHFTLI